MHMYFIKLKENNIWNFVNC